jgi:hypothetical protein
VTAAEWLDRLDQAHAAATPGPWATYEAHGRDYCDEAWSFLGIRSMTGVLPQVAQTHPLWDSESELAGEDAAAIVAEHNATPRLVAALRAVLSLADRLDEDWEAVMVGHDHDECLGNIIRSAVVAALGVETTEAGQ